MIIPYDKIPEIVLVSIIEDFITRQSQMEAVDTGNFEDKVKKVREQLRSGKVQVSFNPEDESCNIILT